MSADEILDLAYLINDIYENEHELEISEDIVIGGGRVEIIYSKTGRYYDRISESDDKLAGHQEQALDMLSDGGIGEATINWEFDDPVTGADARHLYLTLKDNPNIRDISIIGLPD